MGQHRYRKAGGVRGTTETPHGKWQAKKKAGGWYYSMGTFDTAERASLAYRLFCHWLLKGHHPDTIPRQPRTVDAI